MADGVTITSGANSTPPDGTVISTDDAGASGQVQRFKLAMSADGSATHVPADADGLLVNLGANNDVVGPTAAGSPVTASPVLVGAYASESQPVAVDVGDVVNLWANTNGALVVHQDAAFSVTVIGNTSTTGTVTTVADTASNATLLSANAGRLGASITNDSSARLYIKAGTTASTTSYTVSLGQHDYWEVPAGYTGRIDGIWASDPGDGAARITEYGND